MQIEVTSVSTKGQVVIPSDIRKRLGIAAGSKLMVMTDGQNVLMKPVVAPRVQAFRQLAAASRKAAAAAGLRPTDVAATLAGVRRARRA